MLQIPNLTDDADQTVHVTLGDASVVDLEFIFRPSIQQWTVTITYTTMNFELDNIALLAHPNLLRNYRHVLPFGLAINTTDGADPLDIEDFVNGRVTVYVLEPADITDIETNVFFEVAA